MKTNRSRASGRRQCVVLLAGFLLLLGCAVSAAQTTAPVRRDPIENQPIGHRPATQPALTGTAPAPPARRDWLGLPRVVGSLTAVIGLIFVIRWVARRYFPNLASGRAPGVVRLLSRTPVTPKQHVLLVQVGKRVLVVADNGAQMSPLADISDADEVASLIGQLSARPEPAAEEFDDKLEDAKQDFDPQADRFAPAEQPEAAIEPASEEIAGLMQKVRILAKQLGRS